MLAISSVFDPRFGKPLHRTMVKKDKKRPAFDQQVRPR
jgi:hypothetical protein